MLDRRTSSDPLENLLAILLSRKLLAATGFFVIMVITVLGVLSMPPTYVAYTTIFVSSPSSISRIGVPISAEVTGREFLANQITLIKSRVILERVVYRLDLHRRTGEESLLSKTKDNLKAILRIRKSASNPVEAAIEGLRSMVSVRLPRGTNIVEIRTKAQSAEFSATVANAVAEVYVEYAKQLFASSTQSGYGFLEDRFLEAEEKLAAAQRDLDEFKKREMSFLIPAEGSVIAQKLGQLEEERAQIEAQLEYSRREKARAEGGGTRGAVLTGARERNPEPFLTVCILDINITHHTILGKQLNDCQKKARILQLYM